MATWLWCFLFSHSQLTTVINYIQQQEEHHKTRTFREEYVELLKRFEIDYKEGYIFEDV